MGLELLLREAADGLKMGLEFFIRGCHCIQSEAYGKFFHGFYYPL